MGDEPGDRSVFDHRCLDLGQPRLQHDHPSGRYPGHFPEYYEAAEIDGAGVVAKFFNITLPLVTPSLFFILITGLIGAFQIFDTIFMMIGKNTVVLENTQSVVMYFYRNAFELGNKGYACAIAMLLFVIIMFITLLQMIGQKKWVNYD